MSTGIDITAVICTRNRPHDIARAVTSVLANEGPAFELIIVDQSDDDSTECAIASLRVDARLRYFHSTRPGLSAAYNFAIARAPSQLLAFTDDDCVARSNWLASVAAEFASDPSADLLYGQVLAPAARMDSAIIPQLVIPERRRITARHGIAVVGMGANFAARRDSLVRIGGFDEALGGGGVLRSSQDFDLQYRLLRRAGVSLLAPSVVVEHYGARTLEQWPATLRNYGHGDGAFYMKHVRCGDLLAARLLLTQFATECGRSVYKPIVRRRGHSPAYLVGLIRGGVASFRFRVDRRTRLYQPR